MRRFNFMAAITLVYSAAYLGALWWALVHDKMDAQSFVSGLGPSVGVMVGYWFKSQAGAGS